MKVICSTTINIVYYMYKPHDRQRILNVFDVLYSLLDLDVPDLYRIIYIINQLHSFIYSLRNIQNLRNFSIRNSFLPLP